MTTERRQYNVSRTLAKLFASEARLAVLRLFMIDPSRAYYQRQIEAATGLPLRAVQRELSRLTGVQLLFRHSEGNRCYYQADPHFALYQELRALILKTCDAIERLRGSLAAQIGVLAAFYHDGDKRVLVVTEDGARPPVELEDGEDMWVLGHDTFMDLLSNSPQQIEPFLLEGVDLLGRRQAMLWRRIEGAGYSVQKGKGVA